MLGRSLRAYRARVRSARDFPACAKYTYFLQTWRRGRFWAYLPRSPKHGFATFSSASNEYEIDLITLRRKNAPESLEVAPFPTVLDPNAPINGKYDPHVVEKVLRGETKEPGSVDATPATRQFVSRFRKELELLDSFIRLSYSKSIPDMSKLTSMEISNVLYIFRGLYKKGYLDMTSGADIHALDDMVDEFLTLLSDAQPTSRDLTSSVLALLKSPPQSSLKVDLFSAGIGNFLPELLVLSKEYDFNALESVAPIVEKISVLVGEFSRFLEVNGASRHYDADFIKVLIYVLRYKHLKLLLLQLYEKNVSPRSLLVAIKNPKTADFQQKIHVESGEQAMLADLINNSSRNLLNVVFTNTGLCDADSAFAAVSAETEKSVYSAEEKAFLESFIETYLPLVCGGVLPVDAFKGAHFKDVLLNHDASMRKSYLVLESFFDNFEFSLATHLGITQHFHIIRGVAAKLNNKFENSSLEELTGAIELLAEASSPLILEDAAKVHEALVSFSRLSTRGFLIFDRMLQNPGWTTVWERHNHLYGSVFSDAELEVIDLKKEITEFLAAIPKCVSAETLRILGNCLKDFRNELAEFRKHDLRNFKFGDIRFGNLLKYMNTAIAHATIRNESSKGSAITLKNAGSYGQLNELLAANLEPYKGRTEFLDELVDAPVEQKKGYHQIPEELKIHSFVKELEILRNDELKKPFKDCAAEDIVALVDRRCTEFSQGLENLNPSSRMCKENWAVFMKMGGRLKRLFSLNNGNTEILDAVIRSQSALEQLEAKLAQKKRNEEAQASSAETESAATAEKSESSLYAPGPYVQIPEKLGLHDFVDQLALFREELGKTYRESTPTEVLDTMEKRTKEVYNDHNVNSELKMNKDNLVSFIKLHAKLKKLLAWNGGNTAILDTLIYSQKAFDSFEAKLASKTKAVFDAEEKPPYRQIPDDVLMEEYAEELEQLKAALGSNFGDNTAYQIHRELDRMINAEEDPEKRLTLGKLQRNIRMLLKHNGGLTFALDTVLISSKVFENMKNKLATAEASGNKFDMSDFLEKSIPASSEQTIKYNDADEILALLNTNTSAADVGAEKARVGDAIQEALASSMSQEESALEKENPEEYAAIRSLTAQKIRDSYTRKPSKPAEPIDKASLEKALNAAKQEKLESDQEQFRAQTAYEWSQSMCNSKRTLESKTFFNPMDDKKILFEYLVLTPNNEKIYSKENPLGADHSPEDMVKVLEKVAPAALSDISRQINKLQKKNWKVIGGGDKDTLVVLSRPVRASRYKVWRVIRTIFTTTGVVFVVMLGLHVWVDDVEQGKAPELAFPPSENVGIIERSDMDAYEKQHGIKNESEQPASNRTLWQRLFWRR